MIHPYILPFILSLWKIMSIQIPNGQRIQSLEHMCFCADIMLFMCQDAKIAPRKRQDMRFDCRPCYQHTLEPMDTLLC